jgi:hypothetical protein
VDQGPVRQSLTHAGFSEACTLPRTSPRKSVVEFCGCGSTDSAQGQEVWVDHDGCVRPPVPLTLSLTYVVTADDQVKAYIKKIMSQLKEWMYGGKITKLVVVITSKETGEHVERWQFDVSPVQG